MKKITLKIILLLISNSILSQNNDKNYEILKAADMHRGGQLSGVSWSLEVKNYKKLALENEISLVVEASTIENNQFALASFLKPKKFADQKLLIRNNSMWFSKKGIEKKIPISGRQRLTGSAANADVANANYFIDYTIKSSEETTLDNKKCNLFILSAKNNLVSYSIIKYWISLDGNLGLKAEFYGKSDKLIKTATFEYKNAIKSNFKFISNIKIVDNINNNDYTTLDISNVKLTSFNMSKFDK